MQVALEKIIVKPGQQLLLQNISWRLIVKLVLSLNLYALRIIIRQYYNWSMNQSTDVRRGRHCVFKLHVPEMSTKILKRN